MIPSGGWASSWSEDFADQRIAVYAGAGKSGIWQDGVFRGAAREEIKDQVRRGALRLMLGTDAASEGLNLQRLGTLINLDLPWNPTRLEQRKGRIQRIGQWNDVVYVYNMRYLGSVEDRVHQLLSSRLQDIYTLFGQVPDVLEDVWIDVALGEVERAKKVIAAAPNNTLLTSSTSGSKRSIGNLANKSCRPGRSGKPWRRGGRIRPRSCCKATTRNPPALVQESQKLRGNTGQNRQTRVTTTIWPCLGIVHEVPDAMHGAIATGLFPRLHGKLAGHDMTLLDVPQFSEGLFPRVRRAGHEDGLHVNNALIGGALIGGATIGVRTSPASLGLLRSPAANSTAANSRARRKSALLRKACSEIAFLVDAVSVVNAMRAGCGSPGRRQGAERSKEASIVQAFRWSLN